MPQSALRFICFLCFVCLMVLAGFGAGLHAPAMAGDNATQLFSPFTPMEDPNRAVYALGVLYRANLADLGPGEVAPGQVRYPGPLRRLGLRVHAGQKVRILGTDGGLRLEVDGLGSVEGRRQEDGFAWTRAQE